MKKRITDLHSGTLVSGFVIGLLVGAVMALLLPRREQTTALAPQSPPALARPPRARPQTTLRIPDPIPTVSDLVTISRERGQQAARHRRQELGLR